LEVDGNLVKEVERERDGFDARVSLVLEIDTRLKKDDTLVLLGVELHQCLHEILRGRTSQKKISALPDFSARTYGERPNK
jgi:hypothetical protein